MRCEERMRRERSRLNGFALVRQCGHCLSLSDLERGVIPSLPLIIRTAENQSLPRFYFPLKSMGYESGVLVRVANLVHAIPRIRRKVNGIKGLEGGQNGQKVLHAESVDSGPMQPSDWSLSVRVRVRA